MNREKEANENVKKFQDQLNSMNAKLEKVIKAYNEEKTARKRAEKAYESLAEHTSKLKNTKQQTNKNESKHGASGSTQSSPFRKKIRGKPDPEINGKNETEWRHTITPTHNNKAEGGIDNESYDSEIEFQETTFTPT